MVPEKPRAYGSASPGAAWPPVCANNSANAEIRRAVFLNLGLMTHLRIRSRRVARIGAATPHLLVGSALNETYDFQPVSCRNKPRAGSAPFWRCCKDVWDEPRAQNPAMSQNAERTRSSAGSTTFILRTAVAAPASGERQIDDPPKKTRPKTGEPTRNWVDGSRSVTELQGKRYPDSSCEYRNKRTRTSH